MQYLTLSLLPLLLTTTALAFTCETIPSDQHPRIFVEPSCCYELKAHLGDGGGWGDFLGEACLDATARQDGKAGFECLGCDEGGEMKSLNLKKKKLGALKGGRIEKMKGGSKKQVKAASKGRKNRKRGEGDGDDDGMVLTVVESCCYFAEGGWKLGCEDPEDDGDGGDGDKEGDKDGTDGDKKDGEKEVFIRIEV